MLSAGSATGTICGVVHSVVHSVFSKHAPHRAKANADAVKIYGITFNHVDASTGIVSIGSKEGASAVWNLAGQKVSTPRKGVYINQGRKIVVK